MPLMSLVLCVMMTLSITDSKDTRSSSSMIRQRMAHIDERDEEDRDTHPPGWPRTGARKKNAVKIAQKM